MSKIAHIFKWHRVISRKNTEIALLRGCGKGKGLHSKSRIATIPVRLFVTTFRVIIANESSDFLPCGPIYSVVSQRVQTLVDERIKIHNNDQTQKKSPRRGIEPRSGTRQAPILTIKLSRTVSVKI